MNKFLSTLLILMMANPAAFAAGKIQNQDVKSEADLVAAGATKTSLINDTKIYVTASGINDRLDNAIANGALGGSGGGTGKNYLSASVNPSNTGNGDAEKGATTGWSLAHSALTSSFPSTVATATNSFSSAGGVHGGSAASGNLSLAASSTSPLTAKYSFTYTSSAATTTGDMLISDAFTIDSSSQAKVMNFSFTYSATSGATNGNFSGTSSNSFGVAIYDVTAAAWIQPAGVYNIVQSSGVGKAVGTFQTTSSSTQYQIAFYNVNASAGAITMKLDDFSVGPGFVVNAPAMSDWVSYTPTLTSGGNAITLNASSKVDPYGFYRRVGDSVEIIAGFVNGSGGTATGTAGIAELSLPSGITADTSKISASTTDVTRSIGTASVYNGNSPNLYYESIVYVSSNLLRIEQSSTTGHISLSAIVAGFAANYKVKIPVVGWSSNSVMSNDTDTRVVAAGVSGTPPTTSGASAFIFPTVTYDTHGAYNSTTGRYTAPVSGVYKLFGSIGTTNSIAIDIYVNGVAGPRALVTAASVGALVAYSGSVKVNAGDLIDLRSNATSGTNNASSTLFIERTGGPAVVAATETVAAAYGSSQTTTMANSNTVINYDTKVYDTHNAVTTGSSWVFTVPISGKYHVSAQWASDTFTVEESTIITLYQNGVSTYRNAFARPAMATARRIYPALSVTVTAKAGDTLQIRGQSNSGARTLDGSPGDDVWVQIERVGN